MGAIYDRNYYDDKSLTVSEPLRFARIGYDNFVTEDNITASSSLAGFPAESLGNAFTYEIWKPSELPATLTIDAGEPVTADYMGLAVHALSGCEVMLSYSNDGTSYTEAATAAPVRDSAAMVLFDSVTARYWQITITGWATEPTLLADFTTRTYELGDYAAGETGGALLGVLHLGQALAMQRGLFQGHTPGRWARTDEIRPSVSEGGQWLGRSVVRRGFQTSYSWSNLKSAWVRDTLTPFIDAAITQPFFIAWRPEGYADEVLYGWTNKPIQPQNTGPNDYMSVSFTVTAHGDQ